MWSVEVVCVRGAREWTLTGRLGQIADALGMSTHVAHTYLDGDVVVFTGPRAQVVHSGLDSLTPEQRKSAMDMSAEAFRALARGKNDLADAHLHTGPVRIVILPDDDDDKGNRRPL